MRLVLTLTPDNRVVMKTADGKDILLRLSSRKNSNGCVRVCIDAPPEVKICREEAGWDQERTRR